MSSERRHARPRLLRTAMQFLCEQQRRLLGVGVHLECAVRRRIHERLTRHRCGQPTIARGKARQGNNPRAISCSEQRPEPVGQRKVSKVVCSHLQLKTLRRRSLRSAHDSGVVDEKVQRRKVGSASVGKFRHRIQVGKVELPQHHRACRDFADLIKRLLRTLLIPACHHDVGAMLSQHLGGVVANPGVRTRNNRSLAAQVAD